MAKRAPAVSIAILLAFAACVPATPRPSAAPGWSGPSYPGTGPDLLGEEITLVGTAIRPAARDILGSVAYDLPVVGNSWVEAEIDFLVEQRRDIIARWLARGDHYEAFVKQVLQEEGVPTDLVHLAMIESGFVATARSHAGAMGIWQFMPATAREAGLRVDAEVDERMDPVRSTRAAARHLRSLHRSFGDWALAAAAYNAGSGRVSRAMSAVGTRDFWTLAERSDLAVETKQYVPRLYAMTVIGRDRERFGLQRINSSSFAFDSIHVELATPLTEVVRLGETTMAELTQLNPHLIRQTTPAGGYWVWVPAGQGMAMQRAWLASSFRRSQGHGSYTVRRGDTLGQLAQYVGLPAARIRELNPTVDFDRLPVGTNLQLPQEAAQRLSARSTTEDPAVAVSSTPGPAASSMNSTAAAPATPAAPRAAIPAPATHTVVAGENLSGIARRYGTSVAELQRTNGLTSSVIRPGQSLRIPDGAAARPPRSAEHVVRSGDSLWGIARQYGTTIAAIEDANSLGQRPIQPGQKLTIPLSE